MRYLVTGEQSIEIGLLPPQQMAQLLEWVILPTVEVAVKLEADKKIAAGGLFAGGRNGVMIVEAASHEELEQLLMSLPAWGLFKWNVTPLVSFKDRLAQTRRLLEQLKAAAL